MQWETDGYKPFAEDEAIMTLNPTRRKLYAPKGTTPVQLVNGSKQRLYLFGAVSNGKNHCCTYKKINTNSFLRFTRYMLGRYEKLVFILDRATYHHKSKKVKAFAKKNKDRLILWFLPKKLPELNPTEQGWRSSRMNETYKLFDDTKSLGWAVKNHIRREFNVNLFQFWS